jgi:hypothetical protein
MFLSLFLVPLTTYLICTLAHLMVNRDAFGQHAVRAAITPELTARMKNIVDEE